MHCYLKCGWNEINSSDPLDSFGCFMKCTPFFYSYAFYSSQFFFGCWAFLFFSSQHLIFSHNWWVGCVVCGASSQNQIQLFPFFFLIFRPRIYSSIHLIIQLLPKINYNYFKFKDKTCRRWRGCVKKNRGSRKPYLCVKTVLEYSSIFGREKEIWEWKKWIAKSFVCEARRWWSIFVSIWKHWMNDASLQVLSPVICAIYCPAKLHKIQRIGMQLCKMLKRKSCLALHIGNIHDSMPIFRLAIRIHLFLVICSVMALVVLDFHG